PDARIRLPDHLFAEVHTDQIVLKNVMVEHVLCCFSEIDDHFAEPGWPHSKSHVLRIHRASCVIVATDAADAARNEVRVARVLPLHEDAVAPEDRRGAVTLGNLPVLKVNLGEDA